MTLFVATMMSVIAIVLCKIIFRLYQFIKFCVAVNKLPGTAIYPLPKIFLQFIKIKPEDQFERFSNLFKKFEKGIMMSTSSFNEVTVHICKPRHLEVIFLSTENIAKSHPYQNMEPFLGKGLLTSTGKSWFHQRKINTPAFHFGVVNLFSEIMSEKAEILNHIIEKTVKENPGEPIEFYSLAARCALDIICETAMGVNVDVQRNYNSDYLSALHKVAEISAKKITYPWLKWKWIFEKTKLGLEYKSAIETMTNFTLKVQNDSSLLYKKSVIKKKQQSRKTASEKLSIDEKERNETGERKKKAYLDLLLDINENEIIPMTETELREQVDTFMFAGHDTTAVAVNWAIFNLGNNPKIQEMVHQELDDVFGNSTKEATMQEIAELKYLDLVIKENLRLNPPVPQIGRRLTESIELEGYAIPESCNVTLNIFDLHRNPEIWPDPLKFDPDRFLPENCRERHPYAYVPFSAGPRNCIGQKFAVQEQKIVLTSLLRKWKVKSAKSPTEMKLISSFSLRPHNGNPVYFYKK